MGTSSPTKKPTAGSDSDSADSASAGGSASASGDSSDDLTLDLSVPDTVMGMVGNVNGDSVRFDLNLASDYETLTISTCSALSNQFSTTLTLLNSAGATVATDSNSCPGNSQQAELVLNNVPAGSYTVVLSGLDNASDDIDLWVVTTTGTVATTTTTTTTTTTATPTTTTTTTTPAPTTTTTAAPTTTTTTTTTTTSTTTT